MFHLMVLLGVTMTLVALLSCWWWKTGKLWNVQSKATRVLLVFLVMGPFLAEVATQAGWFTTELGRQPWIVYEVLKTGEAVSAVIRPPQVLTSIVLFFLIYVFLTILFVTLLNQKIKHGPEAVKDGEPQLKEPEPFTLRTGQMEK
jgi:cytochrome d ubiquinol oxidase subunit I